MKVDYDDEIKVKATDYADVRLETFEDGAEDAQRNFYLTPKQARKLARKLKRAAKEAEAR